MVYGEQVVKESHLARFGRQYETERVTSETHGVKRVFKKSKQGCSRIRTQSLVYKFHIVVFNVFTIRKLIQYIPKKQSKWLPTLS